MPEPDDDRMAEPMAQVEDIREALAAIWAHVLNRPLGSGSIRPDENFFASGGDSVAAVALLTAIRPRLGFDVDPSAVLDALALGDFDSLVRAVAQDAPARTGQRGDRAPDQEP